MGPRYFLAVDLGASSGRTIVGCYEQGTLSLSEINRFWNGPVEMHGTLHWDLPYLMRKIREGIALARSRYGSDLLSMGVDTWGVDYGLIDSDGQVIGNPVHYRDPRTEGSARLLHDRVTWESIFARTGIQFMEFNTLYQLYALQRANSFHLREARTLLFMPDLITYLLTGAIYSERTIASTSQCYNPTTADWAYDLIEEVGIPTSLFAPLTNPGTIVGNCDALPVVAVGSHDTASAFAAAPIHHDRSTAILSSGTWSLLGAECSAPVITSESRQAGFTNEIGVADTVRFLKNLSGLWIVQELRREWSAEGTNYSWEELQRMALDAPPPDGLFDPSHPRFLPTGPMVSRIREAVAEGGGTPPCTPGQIVRTALESLAELYRCCLSDLTRLTGREYTSLAIVGGGSRNDYLCRLTSNATGLPVTAGLPEATACGNIIAQMVATGTVASFAEAREVVQRSFQTGFTKHRPG